MAKKKTSSTLKVLLIGTAAVLFWRGVWGLMDLYVFPNHALSSYVSSLVVGIAVLLATNKLGDELG